jgi:hypothetical protein
LNVPGFSDGQIVQGRLTFYDKWGLGKRQVEIRTIFIEDFSYVLIFGLSVWTLCRLCIDDILILY